MSTLRERILALDCGGTFAYQRGHKKAREDAAEIAKEADDILIGFYEWVSDMVSQGEMTRSDIAYGKSLIEAYEERERTK